jgi:hypothetical protein
MKANKKKIKDKNHIIALIDALKILDKLHHHFMIKAQNKFGLEEIYFNIIRSIYNEAIANIKLNGGKLKAVFL